jgi:hypothetical protein
MCTDQEASPKRTITMLCRVLGPGLILFGESAAAPEIAGRYKPLIYCIRSGGLAG